MAWSMKDASGERIGNWLVVRYLEYKNQHSIYSVLHKNCGNEMPMRLDRLKNAVNKDGCCKFCNPKAGQKARSVKGLKKKLAEQTLQGAYAMLRMINSPSVPIGMNAPKRKTVVITSEWHGANEAWRQSRDLDDARSAMFGE